MKGKEAVKKRTRPAARLTGRAIRKHETRERILKSAGRLARKEGLAAASVPRVMSGAGLTVGGFYAHFPSKQAMDAELVRSLLGAISGDSLSGPDGTSGLEWIRRAVDQYLAGAHRDKLDGCAYPAVISEIARAAPEVRRAFSDVFDMRVRAVAVHAPKVDGITARERALATLALTLGGLLLARGTKGQPVSDEILAACRKWALPELDRSRS
jgi:TetR/AcrR family transcriptional regulator, transcriptional repressor for nem operon